MTMQSQKITLDFQRSDPRHNARLFIAAWGHNIHGVDNGWLVVSEPDAIKLEFLDFRELVATLRLSDRTHRLTKADAEDTAAMIFHLAPKNWLA